MGNRGYTHIYTGDGKGKTTAALGLCFRAAGHGMRSMIIQFMKGQETGEINAAGMTGGLITIEQYGSPKLLLDNRPDIFQEHRTGAMKGYNRAMELLKKDEFRIVVLDEILSLLNFKLMELNMITELIRVKPEHVELILTGRGAPDELVRLADLVTEMREIKHYYSEGVKARKGIEL